MNDTERVNSELGRLEARLHGCRITDGEFRHAILEAHREGGMEDDANLVVVLRPPTDPQKLRHLEELCRDRFHEELPAGMIAFFRRHDGMWSGEVGEDAIEKTLATDPFYEEGIMSLERLNYELGKERWSATLPDGTVQRHYWPVLPFFDVPDQGWHGLDFSRRTPDGNIPVVTYYFDEQNEDRTEHCAIISPSFGVWLQQWIASGFDAFWFQRARPTE